MRAARFTLIELLVVVAIISILAAMLLPALTLAREHARRAACLSNQKQIALAIMLYADEYDDRLVYPGRTQKDAGVEGVSCPGVDNIKDLRQIKLATGNVGVYPNGPWTGLGIYCYLDYLDKALMYCPSQRDELMTMNPNGTIESLEENATGTAYQPGSNRWRANSSYYYRPWIFHNSNVPRCRSDFRAMKTARIPSETIFSVDALFYDRTLAHGKSWVIARLDGSSQIVKSEQAYYHVAAGTFLPAGGSLDQVTALRQCLQELQDQ